MSIFIACSLWEIGANDLHHLEADTGDIADGVAAATEAGDQHLVVLIDEVQAAVPRHEGRDLLAVLDELHTAALTDGRVRLLRLNADLLHHDALGVGGASERIALVLGAQVGLLVVLVRPQLSAAAVHQLTRAADSTRLGRACPVAKSPPPSPATRQKSFGTSRCLALSACISTLPHVRSSDTSSPFDMGANARKSGAAGPGGFSRGRDSDEDFIQFSHNLCSLSEKRDR